MRHCLNYWLIVAIACVVAAIPEPLHVLFAEFVVQSEIPRHTKWRVEFVLRGRNICAIQISDDRFSFFGRTKSQGSLTKHETDDGRITSFRQRANKVTASHQADPCGQRERNAKRDFCPHFLDSFFQRNSTPVSWKGIPSTKQNPL